MLPRRGKARVRAAHWRAGMTSDHQLVVRTLRVVNGNLDGQASCAAACYDFAF